MAERLKTIGIHITRYGLVIVLLWIGGMKFTAYEAEGLKPLVANSPLMGWVYRLMSVGGFSAFLGVVEIAIGLLIAVRPVWAMGSAVGSALASGMFLTTLSFLLTTPGWEPSLGGFPALSAMPGQWRPCHRPTAGRTSQNGEGRRTRYLLPGGRPEGRPGDPPAPRLPDQLADVPQPDPG